MDRDQLAEHLRFAKELGVAGVSRDPAWRQKDIGSLFCQDDSSEKTPAVFSLTEIRADIGDCTRCKLHRLGRRQIVFGVGNPDADLMFVGEAPGRDEDEQGIPFVGRAGQLLTKIIEAIGLQREDVYIANDVSRADAGFDAETNAVTIVGPTGAESVPLQSKARIAAAVLDRVEQLLLSSPAKAGRHE